MVNLSDPQLDAAFAALADGTRRQLVARLARGEATISELAQPFDMSLPAVSKHLRVLERAGLVARQRQGRAWRCRLVAMPLDDVLAWVGEQRQFWNGVLDSMQQFAEAQEDKTRRRSKR